MEHLCHLLRQLLHLSHGHACKIQPTLASCLFSVCYRASSGDFNGHRGLSGGVLVIMRMGSFMGMLARRGWIKAMAYQAITVSFTSLLEKIKGVVGFAPPIYNHTDTRKNVAYVVVPSKKGPSSYLFSGVEEGNISNSVEVAARKAILFFVRNYNICVQDVNLERKECLRKCRDLYMLKSHELESIEKGIERLPAEKVIGKDHAESNGYNICIDFLGVFREVINKVNINVTPIEYVKYGTADILVWFTVSPQSVQGRLECVVGNRECILEDAKQSLARKALLSLMYSYGFTIEM